MEKSIEKRVLRSAIINKLNKISIDRIRSQSLNVAQNVRSLPEYKNSQKIAYFMHMPLGELHTDVMLKYAFEDGKSVFLPRMRGDVMDMLQVTRPELLNDLQPKGKFKILEPLKSWPNAITDCEGLDMLVVPGVGYTIRGERLGRGGGYYDKYIAMHNKWCIDNNRKKPVLVGVGLDLQLLDHIDCESHDLPVDKIVINDRTFDANENVET